MKPDIPPHPDHHEERELCRVRLHWYAYRRGLALLLPALLTLAGAAVAPDWLAGPLYAFSVALVALGGLVILVQWCRDGAKSITVTTVRVVARTGWIATDEDSFFLDGIKRVHIHRTWLGRAFGFGRLRLEGEGAALDWRFVARPEIIQIELSGHRDA